ncbi:MAG: hypothetical protein JWM33_315 [Caulobacteraceae bacterium]|nr:hypothetical protein [Caulobacteraceae bacterium]
MSGTRVSMSWQTVKEHQGVTLERLQLALGGQSQWRIRAADGVHRDVPDEAAGIAQFAMETRRAMQLAGR